jgi:hypothetical protein
LTKNRKCKILGQRQWKCRELKNSYPEFETKPQVIKAIRMEVGEKAGGHSGGLQKRKTIQPFN